MIDLAARFGDNLACHRKRADLSQEDLSFLASLHRTEISQLERGLRFCRIDTLIKLTCSLEVSADDLLAGINWSPGDYRRAALWSVEGQWVEGIRRRHSGGCNSRNGGRCTCNAGWEVSVYLAREGRKLRRTFAREAEAKTWRADALAQPMHAVCARLLRSRLSRRLGSGWRRREPARCATVPATTTARHPAGIRTRPQFARAAGVRWRRLSELTRADLQDFVDRLLGRKLAASTIRNTMNPLQAIYRHAVRRELVVVNPTREVDLPAARGRREKIATASQAARLIAAVPDTDRAIWAMAFYAGLRRGELQALRSSDIDLGRSEITVERSWDQYEGPIAPKSKAGVRTVPILAVLRDHLDARALGTGSDLVFGRRPDEPFSPKAIADPAKRAWAAVNEREREEAEREGRSPDLLPSLTFHECRHTFASLLIDAGVNPKAIQEFMGHATIEETFSRYGHLMPGTRDQARQLVDAYMDAATLRAA